MSGMVMLFSDEDILDFLVYFVFLFILVNLMFEDVVKIGKVLYSGGDVECGLIVCIVCYGLWGNGIEFLGFFKIFG